MTEEQAQEILLGHDYRPWMKRWQALAATSKMRMLYVGTCPLREARLEFETERPDKGCVTCRTLRTEFAALTTLTSAQKDRIAKLNEQTAGAR